MGFRIVGFRRVGLGGVEEGGGLEVRRSVGVRRAGKTMSYPLLLNWRWRSLLNIAHNLR